MSTSNPAPANSSGSPSAAAANTQPDLLKFFFSDDGSIPNNPTLPLLVYQQALDGSDLLALLAQVAEKIAHDVVFLQRTEVSEV